jgi:hypothetical protein
MTLHLICLSVLALVLLAGCRTGQRAWRTVESARHLKYFGYYAASGFVDKADKPWSLTKLGHSNVVFLADDPQRPIETSLDSSRRNHIKAIVMVYNCFFTCNPGKPGQSSLVTDWKERWNAFRPRLNAYEDVIYAYYFDEPYWNGIREEDFRMVTRMLRQEAPGRRVMAVLCSLSLEPSWGRHTFPEMPATYIEYLTDVGYDWYGAWNDKEHAQLTAKLKAKMWPRQAYWFIPCSFGPETSGHSQPQLVENILKMHELAQANPDCVGLLLFAYDSSKDWGVSADRLFDPSDSCYEPYLKNLHLNIGNSVCSRRPSGVFVCDRGALGGPKEQPGSQGKLEFHWRVPHDGKVFISNRQPIRPGDSLFPLRMTITLNWKWLST